MHAAYPCMHAWCLYTWKGKTDQQDFQSRLFHSSDAIRLDVFETKCPPSFHPLLASDDFSDIVAKRFVFLPSGKLPQPLSN
jgi:hypothetical protein